ncbi:MAG: YIP1 family protein [Myxococcota bacterium]|nr:YIP1 family protein [Myxococcota bacterium]
MSEPSLAEQGARCAVHPAQEARFTCARCGTFGCVDCLFGGAPPPGVARHQVCRACAKDGLDEPVPWERRKELGLWRAFVDTTRLASRSPTRFFRTPAIERGATGAILYAMAAYAAGQIVLLISMGLLMMLGGGIAAIAVEEPVLAGLVGAYGCAIIGLSPFIVGQGAVQAVIGLVIATGGAHGTLALLKRRGGKLEDTLRAIGYSFAPMVWIWIPVCGFYIAYIWALVVEFKAVRETHRIGSDTAALAVFGYRALLVLMIIGLYAAVLALAVLLPQLDR